MCKVTFIDLSRNFYDKHAVYVLATYLKSRGINVSYINEKHFQKALDRIYLLKPDLLLYSAFSIDMPVYIEFDKIVKQSIRIKSIMGGHGPTYDWGIAGRCTIDAFCVGEGEYALAEYILGGFSGGRNILKKGETEPDGFFEFIDLDTLPLPERDLVYQEDAVVKSLLSRQFMSGRGCPYKCTYCFNHAFNNMFKACGPIVRKKSVAYLLAEIQAINQKYPFKNVVFQDDTFILDKKWLFEFCEQFPRKIGLSYTCNIRANLMHEDVAEALKESGCVGINWSIETGNDVYRNEILQRSMSKEKILETGRLLNKYRLPHRIGNIIGLPGEKYEHMLETLQLNIEVQATLSLANIFVPYPGLDLTAYAIENNYLAKEALEHLPKDFFSRSVLNFSAAENRAIQKLLYLFPILARHPVLFHRKRLYHILTTLPRWLLYLLYVPYYVYKLGVLYNVDRSLKVRLLMIARYLKIL